MKRVCSRLRPIVPVSFVSCLIALVTQYAQQMRNPFSHLDRVLPPAESRVFSFGRHQDDFGTPLSL
jgi:hypothetical protein